MTAHLEIDAAAFRANIRAVRARIAPAELMLVTKDDAYGHGLEWTVQEALAEGVRWFGSFDIPSALSIRALAPRARIFAWTTSTTEEAGAGIEAELDLGVGSVEYLRDIVAEAAVRGRAARVHLKIDTGLHRNGIRPEEWPTVIAEARVAEQAGHLRIVGVWSHLAEASDEDDDRAQQAFHDAVQELRDAGGQPEHLHLTASAASWWRPELRGTMCRIGAFCYGVRSADGPELDGIAPVATLSADVLEVGDAGVRLDVGSLDGLPSALVGASVTTPAGPRRTLAIEPTATVVEAWDGASAGQDVVIFGAGGASATDLAERIDTVGEEILTRVSPLLPRRVR